MLDLLLTGGEVVDGTSSPRRRANVGVRGGRVATVTSETPPAKRVVDVGGLTVAPGVVDIHTHYDAQLLWDPFATPSCFHGVTTIVGGNCGFTLSPAAPEDRRYLLEMMARVEGMPLTALETAIEWDWATFPEWTGHLDGRLGVNAGFLAGHSSIRRRVLGPDATRRAARPEEVAAMAEELRAALDAGALGFSTSQATTHHDGAGAPVPSRAAARQELVALADVVGGYRGMSLEAAVAGSVDGFTSDELDLLSDLSARAEAPLNWNLLTVGVGDQVVTRAQLGASDHAAQRGGRVVALVLSRPLELLMSFVSGTTLEALPGWSRLFAVPRAERLARLGDGAYRRALEEGAAACQQGLRRFTDWTGYKVVETHAPENQEYTGRTVGDIAQELRRAPFDVLLDIVVADDLRTGLHPPARGNDDESWQLRAQAWHDDRTIVGGSDGGAHLDIMCLAGYPTNLLGEGVRERGLISLEEAVHQLTDLPARLYSLRDRGRIAPGYWADLFVFDPGAVGSCSVRTADDLPGGCRRLVADATGVHSTYVNGVAVTRAGRLTGETPGQLLTNAGRS